MSESMAAGVVFLTLFALFLIFMVWPVATMRESNNSGRAGYHDDPVYWQVLHNKAEREAAAARRDYGVHRMDRASCGGRFYRWLK